MFNNRTTVGTTNPYVITGFTGFEKRLFFAATAYNNTGSSVYSNIVVIWSFNSEKAVPSAAKFKAGGIRLVK